ncbi:hypothetical protein IEQ34_001064 [Dendrobium chrysotoxum]|uniref:Uncharacterized protein n=1 Tax=Dendrobium chrysotoxum TaxID=161865 RepID=A0AAV7HLI5_DENCH|nr:hypothetical protein IEQ34_001064 [Dendrobium chrysotoxum]
MEPRCGAYGETGNHPKSRSRRSCRAGGLPIHAFLRVGGRESGATPSARRVPVKDPYTFFLAWWGTKKIQPRCPRTPTTHAFLSVVGRPSFLYISFPVKILSDICIVLSVVQSLDRIMYCLECIWIKVRNIKPRIQCEAFKAETDFPMVLVQFPMCNEKELNQNPPPQESDIEATELIAKEKGESVSHLKSLEVIKEKIVGAVSELTKAEESLALEEQFNMKEFWMVEPEMAFANLEGDMNYAESYVKFLCKWLLDHYLEDMEFMVKNVDKIAIECLKLVSLIPFERISYTKAVQLLENVTYKEFENKAEWGVDWASEHERCHDLVQFWADRLSTGTRVARYLNSCCSVPELVPLGTGTRYCSVPVLGTARYRYSVSMLGTGTRYQCSVSLGTGTRYRSVPVLGINARYH